MDTRERIVLYVIVLALAIAVVFLALTGNGGGCLDCDRLDQRLAKIEATIGTLEEIEAAIGTLEESVTDTVEEVAIGINASISTHDDKAVAAHSQMAARLGSIEVSLAGLEGCAAELCPGK